MYVPPGHRQQKLPSEMAAPLSINSEPGQPSPAPTIHSTAPAANETGLRSLSEDLPTPSRCFQPDRVPCQPVSPYIHQLCTPSDDLLPTRHSDTRFPTTPDPPEQHTRPPPEYRKYPLSPCWSPQMCTTPDLPQPPPAERLASQATNADK